MPPSKKPSSADESGSGILYRRKFIRDRIHSVGKVSESELRTWLNKNKQPWSLKAIRNDIQFVSTYEDLTIFETRIAPNDELEWVDDTRKLGASREERAKRNYRGKKCIMDLVCTLLLGFRKYRIPRELQKDSFVLQNRQAILEVLATLRGGAAVANKLFALWREGQRRMFLDSGTTTAILANEYLRFLRLPMHGLDSNAPADQPDTTDKWVNKLEVVTNDREIFYTLGRPEVNTKTIVVGGRQQFRSSTISGMMAETFIKENKIKANVAIVGLTSVNMRKQPLQESFFGCENERVAAIKGLFLQESDLRIMVADSSKFAFAGHHTDTPICPIDKSEVDIVVTDDADSQTLEHFSLLEVPLLTYSRVVHTMRE